MTRPLARVKWPTLPEAVVQEVPHLVSFKIHITTGRHFRKIPKCSMRQEFHQRLSRPTSELTRILIRQAWALTLTSGLRAWRRDQVVDHMWLTQSTRPTNRINFPTCTPNLWKLIKPCSNSMSKERSITTLTSTTTSIWVSIWNRWITRMPYSMAIMLV